MLLTSTTKMEDDLPPMEVNESLPFWSTSMTSSKVERRPFPPSNFKSNPAGAWPWSFSRPPSMDRWTKWPCMRPCRPLIPNLFLKCGFDNRPTMVNRVSVSHRQWVFRFTRPRSPSPWMEWWYRRGCIRLEKSMHVVLCLVIYLFGWVGGCVIGIL
jgi:hypothetical protein